MQTAKEEFAILFKAAISKVVCKVSTLEDELEELKVFRFKFNPDKTAWLLKGVACVLLEFVLSVKREQKPIPQMITYKEVAEQANRLFGEWDVGEEIKFPLRGNALANQLGWI